MLQIRNVLKKLAFLAGVSYFKKKNELKRGGWLWGERGCQGRNAEIKTDQAQLLQINHSKRFPLPQECFDSIFFFFKLTNYLKMTHLCFHLLQSKPTGGAAGTPTRSLLPRLWLGRDACPRKPRSLQILETILPPGPRAGAGSDAGWWELSADAGSSLPRQPHAWSVAEVPAISSEKLRLEQSWISFPSSALFCVQETYPVKFLLFMAHDSSCTNDTRKQFKNKWSFGHLGSSSSE